MMLLDLTKLRHTDITNCRAEVSVAVAACVGSIMRTVYLITMWLKHAFANKKIRLCFTLRIRSSSEP